MTSISTIPRGFKPCLSKYSSPFDKEILQDDDKELWLIRIPDNISEKDLEQLKLKVPTATTTSKLAKLEKDNSKYALYKVPTDNFSSSGSSSSSNSIDDDKAQNDVGISGQEMLSFDCLVPSREDNVDKPFEHCLILDEIVDIPDSTALAESIRDSPIYKREQPEGLKLRFLPTGYYSREDEKSEEEKNKKRSLEEEEDIKEPVKKVKKEKKDKKKKKEKK
ncbi:hypothetical protein G6F70_004127 [Rhizopus microsporus]|nr:hypothetical protein G6F71_003075 [Rhizopus microsporus]KAG1200344.1 hypothetical protein G6F70_004127 [Rhizopus microsporus]KAG1211967.1 hypothetical protein G6F69_004111 [Rhizopus microsporus]KAG1236452.1 hypothetical protein G6F67_001998 [Rhizopus microsporus]KAG1265948.1 hypothetical protein G6F68_003140 [Rhizopus microsporus]